MSLRYCTAALLFCLLVAGCSRQAWYEGVRDARRQNCYELPAGEVQDCLERVDRVGYEQYRREREEMRRDGDAEKPSP